MKRLFTAIHVQPSENLLTLYSELKSLLAFSRIKWVEPDNLHLTLKFFGETDEQSIPGILQALGSASAQSPHFTLHFSGLGVFGSRYDPRVIWMGIHPEPGLLNLAQNIRNELGKIHDFKTEQEHFVPHLTVGRVKEIPDRALFQHVIQKYRTYDIQMQEVRNLILYESILRKEGPIYLKIAGFPLP